MKNFLTVVFATRYWDLLFRTLMDTSFSPTLRPPRDGVGNSLITLSLPFTSFTTTIMVPWMVSFLFPNLPAAMRLFGARRADPSLYWGWSRDHKKNIIQEANVNEFPMISSQGKSFWFSKDFHKAACMKTMKTCLAVVYATRYCSLIRKKI